VVNGIKGVKIGKSKQKNREKNTGKQSGKYISRGRGLLCVQDAGVHRVHRTVYNNSLRTVRGDPIRKINGPRKNVSFQVQ
jgi:hypothetical protein